jgi:hypothetical protein
MYGYSFSTAGKRGMAQKKSYEQQGNKGWGSVEGDLNRNPQTIQYTIGKNIFVRLFLGFFYDTLSIKDVFC